MKSKVEQTFKEAFNIPAVGQAFAWEAMTGWEKFGGKTFGVDYSYRHTDPFQGSHSLGARINL